MRKNLLSLFVAATLCTATMNANEAGITATVVAYNPAPGQFINKLPIYEAGDDSLSMAALAESKIVAKSMITLGAFGGNVIFKLSAPMQNVEDAYDFSIFGNSFEGSSEPGIVSVSVDENRNGLPDDEWYELEGAAWDSVGVIRNYSITYYKPTAELDAATGNHPEYIRWKDNQDSTGWLPKNGFHPQSYYPLWYGDSITFTGTMLPNNCYDKSGNGSNWVLPGYEWGYVDNRKNADVDKNSFKIDHARNAAGERANLTHIDFIKVHNGMYAVNGWLGEASTEVQEIKLLSPEYTEVDAPAGLATPNSKQALIYSRNQNIFVNGAEAGTAITIYSINGTMLYNGVVSSTAEVVSVSYSGMAIVKVANQVVKITL